MFTDRPDGETADERLKPDFIVDYLSRFQRAIVVYLEFLIFIKKIEVRSQTFSFNIMCEFFSIFDSLPPSDEVVF